MPRTSHAFHVSASTHATVALTHAATCVPNHLVSELQELHPPIGVTIERRIEDGTFILGDSPGTGIQIDEKAVTARRHQPHTPQADGPHIRPERAGLRLLTTTTDKGPDPVVARTRPTATRKIEASALRPPTTWQPGRTQFLT